LVTISDLSINNVWKVNLPKGVVFVICISLFAFRNLINIFPHFEDELGDDYPEVKEEVHLEDFFWTGSGDGDGPPDYLKKVHTGISKGKDVIVKTETVVATVYVDGNNVSCKFRFPPSSYIFTLLF